VLKKKKEKGGTSVRVVAQLPLSSHKRGKRRDTMEGKKKKEGGEKR